MNRDVDVEWVEVPAVINEVGIVVKVILVVFNEEFDPIVVEAFEGKDRLDVLGGSIVDIVVNGIVELIEDNIGPDNVVEDEFINVRNVIDIVGTVVEDINPVLKGSSSGLYMKVSSNGGGCNINGGIGMSSLSAKNFGIIGGGVRGKMNPWCQSRFEWKTGGGSGNKGGGIEFTSRLKGGLGGAFRNTGGITI